MKTEMIKKEGSFSGKVTEALKAKGYPTREVETVGKNGTVTVKTLVHLGDAPCRTFESLADVTANLSENKIVAFCTEKAHVLDKKTFESAVLEKEGLKEVSESQEEKAVKAAKSIWEEQGGSDDFSGIIKTKKSTLTFGELKDRMVKAMQS